MPNYHLIDLGLVALATMVLPAYGLVSGRQLRLGARSQMKLVRRYWFTIGRGLLISALILVTWHWLGRPYAALGLALPVNVPGQIGFGIDALLGCAMAYELWKLSPDKAATARARMNDIRMVPQSRAEFAIFPLLAIVASPTEELLFRGYLLWALAPVTGIWGAVAVSSIAFGLGHAYQGWVGILRTGLIGAAIAVAFVLTRSLWWLMLAHTMMNLFADLYARKVLRFPSLAPAVPAAGF